nr:sulfatase-like hydrolase/transferase [Bacteroidota bacterium]
MTQIIKSLIKQFLFWMTFFALARLVFILYYIPTLKIDGAGFSDTIASFYHALRLDAATASYFMAIPVVLLLLQSLWYLKIFNLVNKIYSGIVIFIYMLITCGEIGLYEEWKTKLNCKALLYLRNPDEVFNSTDNWTFTLLVIIAMAIFSLSLWAYLRLFYRNITRVRPHYLYSFLFLIITSALGMLTMRGGLQEIPINQSESYYSDINILNLTATNNAFNVYICIHENLLNINGNPFNYYPIEEARKTVADIYTIEKDTTIQILTTRRPNIVMLMLESWSADLIESLGGEAGITPEFKKLESEGILFTGILSSGSRSEQGMASIFGGFPAHPISSVTVQPDKHNRLPSLIHDIEKVGYSTSFYFGGQLIYGNIKAYIYYNNFDRIVEGKDFDDDEVIFGKLGVHDEFTMKRVLDDLENEKEPFFTALFTLSSHSPYDQPMEDVFDWGENENRYINSAYYTDRCLGEFFEGAKSKSWYDNTLFILVADHSHNSYRNWSYQSVEYHSIPMLFYGEVIKPGFRGIGWGQPGSQVDLPATILAQMDLPHEQFGWSRNMFNPYSPKFRYFGFDNGVIWTEPHASFGYNAGLGYYCWELQDDFDQQVIKNGKSYMQAVFEEYLSY